MADTCKAVILNKRPREEFVLGETFKVVDRPKPKASELRAGQVMVETLVLSLDPTMRTWVRETRGYMDPVPLGEVMRGTALSRVVASRLANFKEGDLVVSFTGWSEFAITSDELLLEKAEIASDGHITDALGILGFIGLTAYFGIIDVGNVKAGDTVVVSGAAGATGSVACQIAKLKGARVIGIAGGDDKVKWLKELGCDDALNYKDPTYGTKFQEMTEEGIDVFFDNVGGELLELALPRAKLHARFVICGAISQYNATEQRPIKNITSVLTNRMRMEGFLVLDYADQFPAARHDLSQWLVEGKLQRKEHIVKGGIAQAPEALIDLFQGANTGKMLLDIRKY